MFPWIRLPRSRSLSTPGLWILAAFFGSVPVTDAAQATPRILHEGLGCMASGQHAIVDALVEPADDLVTVKIYFRAEIYPAFFYVEMARTGDLFRAVLPRPTSDIDSVIYYLEAVDKTFNSLRTEEFRTRVVQDPSDCDDDSPTPAYLEGPANIVVGATTEGATLPPGFLPEGIVGTITAAGRVAAAGGGTGTLVAVGAAAAGAAGVGALVAGGNDSTTTVPAVGVTTTQVVTTSIPVTTTIVSSAVTACFQTEPSPPTIPVGSSVRFDATCSTPRDGIVSYTWDFNDGRDGREGRVITRVYNTAGVFPAELTVTDSAGNQDRSGRDVRVQEAPSPGPGPGPGPSSTVPGFSDREISGLSFNTPPGQVNASEGYTINYRNLGPDFDPTVTIIITFNPSGAGGVAVPVSAPGCGTSTQGRALVITCFIGSLASGASGARSVSVRFPSSDTYNVTAAIVGGTSDSEPGNNSRTVSTPVALRAETALETAFVSEIQSSTPGSVRGILEMNGSETAITDDSGARRHMMKARPGTNLLVGYASGANLEGASWTIDFSLSQGFVPGSIFVEAGDVLEMNGRSVVLRLSGRETRIRLRFQSER